SRPIRTTRSRWQSFTDLECGGPAAAIRAPIGGRRHGRRTPRSRLLTLLRVRRGFVHVLLILVHRLLRFALLVFVLRHLIRQRVEGVLVLRQELAVVRDGGFG